MLNIEAFHFAITHQITITTVPRNNNLHPWQTEEIVSATVYTMQTSLSARAF
jgi:hypothetical protein